MYSQKFQKCLIRYLEFPILTRTVASGKLDFQHKIFELLRQICLLLKGVTSRNSTVKGLEEEQLMAAVGFLDIQKL